jgi:hypothetical protein
MKAYNIDILTIPTGLVDTRSNKGEICSIVRSYGCTPPTDQTWYGVYETLKEAVQVYEDLIEHDRRVIAALFVGVEFGRLRQTSEGLLLAELLRRNAYRTPRQVRGAQVVHVH